MECILSSISKPAISHLNQDVCIEDEDYDDKFAAESVHLGVDSQKSSHPGIKGFGNCVVLSSQVLLYKTELVTGEAIR